MEQAMETLHCLMQEIQNKYKIDDNDILECFLIIENLRENK